MTRPMNSRAMPDVEEAADAVLRGETIDNVLERVVGRIKPPLGVEAPLGNGKAGDGPTAAPSRRRRTRAPEGASSR